MMNLNPIDNNLQYANPQQTYFAPPPKSSKGKWIITAAIIVALGLVGGITYLVQQSKVDSLNAKIASLNKQLDDANKAAAAAQVQSTDKTTEPTTTSTKDVERESDIRAVASNLEVYYANNSFYPTFSNLNDPNWVPKNLKSLDPEATRDPAGSLFTFLSSSTSKQYGYAPANNAGSTCSNTAGNECTKFTLTYTTEDGTQQTVKSLN